MIIHTQQQFMEIKENDRINGTALKLTKTKNQQNIHYKHISHQKQQRSTTDTPQEINYHNREKQK